MTPLAIIIANLCMVIMLGAIVKQLRIIADALKNKNQ